MGSHIWQLYYLLDSPFCIRFSHVKISTWENPPRYLYSNWYTGAYIHTAKQITARVLTTEQE